MLDELPCGRKTQEGRFQLHGIGKGSACYRSAKISLVKEFVCLLLSTFFIFVIFFIFVLFFVFYILFCLIFLCVIFLLH